MSKPSGTLKTSFVKAKGQRPVLLSFRSSVWLIAVVILLAFFTVRFPWLLDCWLPQSSLEMSLGWLCLWNCAFKQWLDGLTHTDKPRSSRSYHSRCMTAQACLRINVSNYSGNWEGSRMVMPNQCNFGARHYWLYMAGLCSYRLVSLEI